MSKKDNRTKNKDFKPEVDDAAEIMDNVPEAEDEAEFQDENTAAENDAQEEMKEIDRLAKELAEEKIKVEKEKKEYLFLMAEFDNFRKRTLKEKSDIIKNAAESAMKGLLPIVDDFERGIEANKNSEDPTSIREGMELIYNKLVKYLEQNGVKPIESTGNSFDPELHEAIAMVPVQDETQKSKVIDTPTKGYTINDKVLRHAKVVVGE